jgi:hypothetical protein
MFNGFMIVSSRAIFGVNPETIDDYTIDLCFDEICNKHKSLTLNDLQLAFKAYNHTEKVFVLSKTVFMRPIEDYARKKAIVVQEIELELERESEKKNSEQKEIEFRQQAKTVYLESLKQGKWLGTIFQAAAIGRNFSNVISDEDREKWNRLAKEMEKKNNLENKNNPIKDFVPIPWQKFYAQFAMEDLISRRQKFIEI